MAELTEEFIRKNLKIINPVDEVANILKYIINSSNFYAFTISPYINEHIIGNYLHVITDKKEFVLDSSSDINLLNINKQDLTIFRKFLDHLSKSNLYIKLTYYPRFYVKDDRILAKIRKVDKINMNLNEYYIQLKSEENEVICNEGKVYTTMETWDKYKNIIEDILFRFKMNCVYNYVDQIAITRLQDDIDDIIFMHFQCGDKYFTTNVDIRYDYLTKDISSFIDYLITFKSKASVFLYKWDFLNSYRYIFKSIDTYNQFINLIYTLHKLNKIIKNHCINKFIVQNDIFNIQKTYLIAAMNYRIYDLEELTKIIIAEELI